MSVWSRAMAFWERVGPRARDIALIGIALLATFAETLAQRDDGPGEWAFLLVVGVGGSVALWWRRYFPVAVTAVGIAVLLITHLPVVVVVALFSLAVRRRDRVLAIMTVAAAGTFAFVSGLDGSEGWIELLVLGMIQAGFCAAAGSYVGARRDLVVSLRERAVRAEEERELRAEQAKLDERTRIAREMHDVLAHKVSLIALHAGGLEMNPTADAGTVHRTAGLIRSTAREAMEDLREVLGVLRSGGGSDDADLVPQPRSADIVRVVEASRAAGVQAELTMDVPELPDAIARTVHRVVQEALTNVHKHARGAETAVTISGNERRGVTVAVVNQRPVASAALLPGSGAGLLGLRERITLLGGSFESGPAENGRWRVVAWLPWNVGRDQAAPATGGAA